MLLYDLIEKCSYRDEYQKEHPDRAYYEWMRVLKPGGVLLNFDANWYHHLFDEEKRAAYEAYTYGRLLLL